MPALSEHLRLAPAAAAALREGARVAVIGASGWLGGAALAMLDRALPRDGEPRGTTCGATRGASVDRTGGVTDAAFAAQVMAFGSHERDLALPSGRAVRCRRLDDLAADPGRLGDAAVLHFAYRMREEADALGPAGYGAANAAIQAAVVAAVERGRPRSLFFASSGAVYRPPAGTVAARDLYGLLKGEHERQFEALAGATAVTNGRVFTVAGEFINRPDTYALASMLTALRGGGPVRLRSAREVWRSYAYVGDIVNLALALGLARRGALALDIAGGEPVEIGRLAALCAALAGRPASVERPMPDGAPPDRMLGDAARYEALMAEMGLAPLPLGEQLRATALYLGALRGG